MEKKSVSAVFVDFGAELLHSDEDVSGASLRHLTMSARTRGVAVAVNAIIGTEGSIRVSLSHFSSLYAGRKSWPHSLSGSVDILTGGYASNSYLIQCASSTATRISWPC